jgi:hypothetical protein
VVGDQVLVEGIEVGVDAGRVRGTAGRATGIVDQDVDGLGCHQRGHRIAQRLGLRHVRHQRPVALRVARG